MIEEKLRESIKNSLSIAAALKKMNINITASNYKTFHNNVKKYNIDISHFLGQAHLKNKEHITVKYIPLNKILIENSSYKTISQLKIRLVRKNLLEYKCAECKLDSWNNKSISLQLDHINGISNDHRIENLRFLCPNCHSQTETFAGRNARKAEIISGKPNCDYCKCGNEKRKESKVCRICSGKERTKTK